MNSIVSVVLFGGLIVAGLSMYIGAHRRPQFRRIYGDPSLPYGDTWVRADDSRAGYSGGFGGDPGVPGYGGDGGGHGCGGGGDAGGGGGGHC